LIISYLRDMKSNRKKQPRIISKASGRHKQIARKSGLPPETLVHVGKVYLEKTTVDSIFFNENDFSIDRNIRVSATDKGERIGITWLKASGLHEVDIIRTIGKRLNISQLLLEDILNTGHRPKLEEDQDYLFLTMRWFYLKQDEINAEQISFLLGSNYLVSFQETDTPIFEPILSRLENGTGKIRQKGADYLLYNLVDAVVDNYFAILENLGDQLEDLEQQIFEKPARDLVEKNQLIRKNILALRKALIPTQEAINALIKTKPDLIDKNTFRYFADILDHVVQSIDYLDTYRDISTEIKESYLSNITYRMNQVIKLLTIITTIFIPLTFIAGIYGMNFRYMPELEWKYGYFIILGIMLLILIGMLIYFRRRKWL
jgi:magnesium transporter